MAVYATREDLRAALRRDSLAKLSVDPSVPEVVGTGTGALTTFTTPFEATTTARVFVNGTEATTGWALSRATGTDGRDQVVFVAAPALGAVVTVSADAAAVHADDLDAVLASVSADIEGYLQPYLPVSDATLLATLKAKTILGARIRLRGRRNLDVVDPLEQEWRAAVRWLELVAEGKIPLPSPTSTSDEDGPYVYGSHGAVFSDPDEETSL